MGELHIIMGPMFSSKTSQIIRLVKKYAALEIPTFVVNHSLDTRFHNCGDENAAAADMPEKSGIFTHDGQWCEGIQTSNLSEIFVIPAYQTAKVILIDEANFFASLREVIQFMVECDNKIVFIAGLSGTFDRGEFGQLAQLIPIADSVTMLQSICMDCGDGKTPAIFTKLRESIEQNSTNRDRSLINIGGKEKYKSVCRKHFIENK